MQKQCRSYGQAVRLSLLLGLVGLLLLIGLKTHWGGSVVSAHQSRFESCRSLRPAPLLGCLWPLSDL